ncbi:hypothetical protein GCM10023231_10370 [Olivibacter ginsenosidimutans]|uniref:Peptidyl-prolyl cis-trans isomerase n=1 Tax=Olivibacter ginsenosidimutans TaxID=1176537 RepID=A0ABP9AQN1_9SPHI
MRKLYLLFLTLVVGLMAASCDKEEVDVYDRQSVLEREAPLLSAYVTRQALSDDSIRLNQETGIWYALLDSGKTAVDYLDTLSMPGEVRLKNMQVKVKYTGRLLDSTLFEQNTDADSIPYVSLLPSETGPGQVQAWQLAFYPKAVGGLFEGGLKKGAKIRVITPSVFGYQNQSHGLVKENSPLDYEMEILDIKEVKEPTKTE